MAHTRVYGVFKRDHGHWQLDDIKAEYGSLDGALHLGSLHIVLETAAIDLAADLVGPPIGARCRPGMSCTYLREGSGH